jgi:hypothetical protein
MGRITPPLNLPLPDVGRPVRRRCSKESDEKFFRQDAGFFSSPLYESMTRSTILRIRGFVERAVDQPLPAAGRPLPKERGENPENLTNDSKNIMT